jgi:hypothetical protein
VLVAFFLLGALMMSHVHVMPLLPSRTPPDGVRL